MLPTSSTIKNSQDSQPRIRTLSEKGEEQFQNQNDDFKSRLQIQWAVVENLISSYSSSITNLNYLENFENGMSKAYALYCSISSEYVSFLLKTRTEASLQDYQHHLSSVAKCKQSVNHVIEKITEVRQVAVENASRQSKSAKSKQSRNSRASNSSPELARIRAKAEATKVRLDYIQQEKPY